MDIFMRNVPFAANEEELVIQLARILHIPPFPLDPPVNFQVKLMYRNRSNRHKGCGLLTLPETYLGETFLRAHGQTGLLCKGRKITFQQSNRPFQRGVVERLRARPWKDPQVLERERQQRATNSGSLRVDFSFGRYRLDGTFCGDVDFSGVGKIACNMDLGQLKLTVDQSGEDNPEHQNIGRLPNLLSQIFSHMSISAPEISAIYMSNQIKAVISSSQSHQSRAFVQSSTPPIFEEEKKLPNFMDYGPDVSRKRLSSLHGEKQSMPPGCNVLCLKFFSHNDLDTFIHRCKMLHLPSVRRQEIEVTMDTAYSQPTMALFDAFLLSMDFPLAFQAEKAMAESILEPLEIASLKEKMLELQHTFGSAHAAEIFRYFLQMLIEQDHELPSRQRRKARHRVANDCRPTLLQQFSTAITAYGSEPTRIRPFEFITTTYFESYHLILTPSTRILDGPLPDQSNSVLRRFGNHDCFVRVSFHDEHRSKLRRDLNLEISDLLNSRFGGALKKGLVLAGRKYEFLGYSMSGLREHAVWFMCPFTWNEREMDTESVRAELGDFSGLAYQPARLAARWSQGFSATDPSVSLDASQIQDIPDRTSSVGSLFTDGCSTISPVLADEAWAILRAQRGQVTGKKQTPSGYQYRLGGAKGVVVVDNQLTGKVLTLRPSQTKFIARDIRFLEIQSTSANPRPMFLNRPMIVVLEFLGVSDEALVALQDNAIYDVEASRSQFQEASKVFGQNGLGASFRMPSLFSNLRTELGLEIASANNPGGVAHRLVRESIRCACTHVLREIKYRAHVRVPGSFTLLGAADEYNCLREGEIYATVYDERTKISQFIEGRVLITRSPQVHPGDIQYATAVRRPELSHIKNVVIFSCQGRRSLPSCLGGGDLDGDDYNIILDPTLLPDPERIVKPGEYQGLPNKTTLTPCTVADVADFVIDYIQSDLLGVISILHLRFADLKGPACDECINLAEFASHAVDFPKTGTAVDFKKLPRPPSDEKPDYLSHEGSDGKLVPGFYRSDKVLGTLFRRVPVEEHSPPLFHDEMTPSDGSKIRRCLLEIRMDEIGLPALEPPTQDVMDEMAYLLEAYSDHLLEIAQAHALSKLRGSRLSEEELVSGTIMAKWADHRKRREAVNAMNLQTQQLAKAIRREFIRDSVAESSEHQPEEWDSDDEDELDDEEMDRRVKAEMLKRAWAAWNVAEETLHEDPEAFGAMSFGIVALGTMLELIKKQRTGTGRIDSFLRRQSAYQSQRS